MPIYVFLIPTGYNQRCVFNEIHKYAIIPAVIARRQELLASANHTGLHIIPSQNTQPSGEIITVPDEQIDSVLKKQQLQKIILAFDGAFEQVAAALDELQVKCEPQNIDLFKWAAACSGYQQANDVGRIHAK